MSKHPAQVAIVGGGASAALSMIHLAKTAAFRSGLFEMILVSDVEKIGRGVAYGRAEDFHLLNVRKDRMSADPDRSDEFSKWIESQHLTRSEHDFQSRSLYGDYLGSLLSDLNFRKVSDRVTRLDDAPDRKIRLSLATGKDLFVDRVVLAAGHAPAKWPKGLEWLAQSDRTIVDPWNKHALASIQPTDSLLVLGSGLTAVDFVIDQARRTFKGTIQILSRRGLRPQVHLEQHHESVLRFPLPDESVRGVLHAIRNEAKRVGERWPDVIDRVRVEAARLWRNWDEAERKRFLRHVRVYWDVHRHRVAPEVGREWEACLNSGRVRLEAGRVVNASFDSKGISARIRFRNGEVKEMHFDRVVNCTGLEPDVSLIADSDFKIDPLGLGVPTDEFGCLYRKNGSPDFRISVLGPALRSRFWEMTAIPDLRGAAKILASAIDRSFG